MAPPPSGTTANHSGAKRKRNSTTTVPKKKKPKQTSSNKKRGNSNNNDSPLLKVQDLNNYDVLLGRGNGAMLAKGNIHFRCVVYEFKGDYQAALREEKTRLAQCVVQRIHDEGGRFLELAPECNVKTTKPQSRTYRQVSNARALEKTCQCLRERCKAPEEYEQYCRKQQKKGTTTAVKKKPPKGDSDSANMEPVSLGRGSGGAIMMNTKLPAVKLPPKSAPPPPKSQRLQAKWRQEQQRPQYAELEDEDVDEEEDTVEDEDDDDNTSMVPAPQHSASRRMASKLAVVKCVLGRAKVGGGDDDSNKEETESSAFAAKEEDAASIKGQKKPASLSSRRSSGKKSSKKKTSSSATSAAASKAKTKKNSATVVAAAKKRRGSHSSNTSSGNKKKTTTKMTKPIFDLPSIAPVPIMPSLDREGSGIPLIVAASAMTDQFGKGDEKNDNEDSDSYDYHLHGDFVHPSSNRSNASVKTAAKTLLRSPGRIEPYGRPGQPFVFDSNDENMLHLLLSMNASNHNSPNNSPRSTRAKHFKADALSKWAHSPGGVNGPVSFHHGQNGTEGSFDTPNKNHDFEQKAAKICSDSGSVCSTSVSQDNNPRNHNALTTMMAPPPPKLLYRKSSSSFNTINTTNSGLRGLDEKFSALPPDLTAFSSGLYSAMANGAPTGAVPSLVKCASSATTAQQTHQQLQQHLEVATGVALTQEDQLPPPPPTPPMAAFWRSLSRMHTATQQQQQQQQQQEQLEGKHTQKGNNNHQEDEENESTSKHGVEGDETLSHASSSVQTPSCSSSITKDRSHHLLLPPALKAFYSTGGELTPKESLSPNKQHGGAAAASEELLIRRGRETPPSFLPMLSSLSVMIMEQQKEQGRQETDAAVTTATQPNVACEADIACSKDTWNTKPSSSNPFDDKPTNSNKDSEEEHNKDQGPSKTVSPTSVFGVRALQQQEQQVAQASLGRPRAEKHLRMLNALPSLLHRGVNNNTPTTAAATASAQRNSSSSSLSTTVMARQIHRRLGGSGGQPTLLRYNEHQGCPTATTQPYAATTNVPKPPPPLQPSSSLGSDSKDGIGRAGFISTMNAPSHLF